MVIMNDVGLVRLNVLVWNGCGRLGVVWCSVVIDIGVIV